MYIVIIICLLFIVLSFLFIASYIKCPPDMVFLISGLKKEPRIITGKASLRIPFFERIDKLTLELIQIDVKTSCVPTADFINVNVDAVANVRIPKDSDLIKVAAQHFLNQNSDYISSNIQQVLEGNMREIIGQMYLKDLVNNKKMFSSKVQENAKDDINRIGLEIVSLNVQSCTDENNAIKDLGIDNLVQIQKTAKIAKAESEKEIKIAEAKAMEDGSKAENESLAKIAEQQKDLELKKATFKIEQDKKLAEANSAYKIQEAEQLKLVNEKTVTADIIKTEKLAELREREVVLKEKELDAFVRKQADADKYETEQKAQAEKLARIQKAEAELEEAKKQAQAKIELAKANKQSSELEAEGLKAKLLAEAEGKEAMLLAEAKGIKEKALAEAEGIEKKALAQAKMKSASVLEMAFKSLPEIAKEVSAPLNNIDSIVMYGDQSNELLENSTKKISKVVDVVEDSLGLNVKDVLSKFLEKNDLSDNESK